jgi:hypothetical protein
MLIDHLAYYYAVNYELIERLTWLCNLIPFTR